MFAPWLRGGGLARPLRLRAMAWGAVQFGAMYALYIAAFRDLPAYGVALLTVTTPIYVVVLWSGRHARRRLARPLAAALLAVAGAALIVARGPGEAAAWWRGALLVQASNLCFAAGTLAFRGLAARAGAVVSPARLTAWMYLGAALLTAPVAALAADRARLVATPADWATLAYLGLLPTAAGFYLWNRGAARAAPGVVAAANNLKVPLGVAAAWLLFGERADPVRTAAGAAIIAAALVLARERHGPVGGVAAGASPPP